MSKAEVSEQAARYLSRQKDRPGLEDAEAFVRESPGVQLEVLAELRAGAVNESGSAVVAFVALGISLLAAIVAAMRGDAVWWVALVLATVGLGALIVGIVLVAQQQSGRKRAVAWLGALEDELRMHPPTQEDERRRRARMPEEKREPAPGNPGSVVPPPSGPPDAAAAAAHRGGPAAPADGARVAAEASDAHAGRHRGGPSRRSVRRAGEEFDGRR